MKYKFLNLFVIIIAFTSFKCHNKNTFNYKYPLCEGLLTKTEVYFQSKKIGIIKSIDLKPSTDYCYGKIEFKVDFEVYSNMKFYNELSLISNSRIYIRIDTSENIERLHPNNDTIILFAKKQY